jgi:hypothetical protein
MVFIPSLSVAFIAAAALATPVGASAAPASTTFEVLTHYRTRILGRCIGYRATVIGTASFMY